MADKGAAPNTDTIYNGKRKEGAESERPLGNVIPKQESYSTKNTIEFYTTNPQSEKDVEQKEAPGQCDPSMDVNMEATIDPDDVVRAGGFGARDDLSSFLPIASDSTDFEASLLDARDYEEPQGEQSHPGLGSLSFLSVKLSFLNYVLELTATFMK